MNKKIAKRLLLAVAAAVVMCFSIMTSPGCVDPPLSAQPVSWLKVATGVSDTTKFVRNWYVGQFPSTDFEMSFARVAGAVYYEIRVLPDYIMVDNWDNAVVVKKVPNDATKDSITTRIALRPKIDKTQCNGCGECQKVCPKQAITIVNGKSVIDYTKCTGCGECFKACVFNAISNSVFGRYYYYAVRAFDESGYPINNPTSSPAAYKEIYRNHLDHQIAKDRDDRLNCRLCGSGCYILLEQDANFQCPVNAVYFDPDTTFPESMRMIFIDPVKCIYCGNCLKACARNMGEQSVRAVIVQSTINFQGDTLQPDTSTVTLRKSL